MGKHGTEKVKMGSKKKIVIISVVVAVVIIAGLVAGYFFFLRDDGTISKSRIKEDIANSNILSQKIGDYQQEFQIADFTYSTKEEDKQTAVMLTHYEDFLGRLTENMQARCANNLMM